MSATRKSFALKLLGGCSLERVDGEPHTGRVAQRRRLACLAVVAAAGRSGITRDRLVALLWPESASEPARHRLADTLHVLRAALGEDAVRAIGERVVLDTDAVACDLREFDEAMRRGDAAAAVAAYGGPFLDGFHIPDAPEFERWADGDRERVAHDLARALQSLAEQSEAAGDQGAAVGWWRRLAAHEPYSARVVLRLMRALEAAGDRAGAIRHAALHAALLRDEIDAEPDAEVLSLAERLRRPPAVPASGAPSAVGASMAAQAPEVASSPAVPGARPHAAGPPGRPPLTLGVPAEEAVDGSRRPAASPHPPAQGGAARTPPRRRAWMTAAVLALVAAGALSVVRAPAAGDPGDTASTADGLLVVEFENRAGDATLVETVTEVLRTDLARSPRIALPSAQEVREGLALMRTDSLRPPTSEQALTLARRLSAKALLAGGVGTAGRGFVLTARLVATADGRTVDTFRETAADSSEVVDAIDRLSRAVRRAAGESVAALDTSPRLYAVTSGSVAALGAYTRSVGAAARGDWLGVAEHSRTAVALDPEFASAYRRLGVALGYLGVRRAERVEALSRAYALRERLSRYEQGVVEATYFAHALGDDRRAVARYRTLLAEFPIGGPARRGSIPRHNLFEAYYSLGEWEHAERVSRALLDSVPQHRTSHLNQIQSLIALGELRAADSAIRVLTRAYPDHPSVATTAARLATARRDHGRALALVDSALAADAPPSPATHVELLHQQRSAAAATGRVAVRDRADRELARVYERLEAGPELLRVAAERAELDASLGYPDRARQRLDSALARHPLAPMAALDRPYAALAAAWAAAGRPDRGEGLLGEWAREVPAEHQPLDAFAVLRAEILTRLAQGRAADAERLAREGRFGACSACADLYLARAFDARGLSDSTIAAYERYLAASTGRELLDPTDLARAYRRLGELHDARGDGTRATQCYGEFVTLWSAADAVLRPRVRSVSQRLSHLRARRAGA